MENDNLSASCFTDSRINTSYGFILISLKDCSQLLSTIITHEIDQSLITFRHNLSGLIYFAPSPIDNVAFKTVNLSKVAKKQIRPCVQVCLSRQWLT